MLCVYTREDSGFGSWFSQGREEEGEGREGGGGRCFVGLREFSGLRKTVKVFVLFARLFWIGF